MSRSILPIVTIFFIGEVLDAIIYDVFLSGAFQATATLWRPQPKLGWLFFSHFVSSVVFVSIYVIFIANKNMLTSLKYGLLFGLGTGISAGYGTYAVMPVSYIIALAFFLNTMAKTTLGGIVLGFVFKK